ncbi:MAG: IS200/IS605 family transposase [Chitinophagaceae bacterium]
MANTYTQLHIQFVFAVKYRQALINNSWEDSLYKYITGILQNKNHKMIQINGMADHIHFLIGLRPDENISSLIKVVKSESSKWINDNKLTIGKFAWQEGFGAFSYSKSHVQRVTNYIITQKEHHKKEPFLAEYKRLLAAFEVDWDERYIFKDLE